MPTANMSGGASLHAENVNPTEAERRKAARQSLITEAPAEAGAPLFGVPGSLNDFLGKLKHAEPGTEPPNRKWKPTSLLIKPTYADAPRKEVFAQVQNGDEVWLRFTDGTIIGLKEQDIGDGNRKVNALRNVTADILIDLGAIDESQRAEVQEVLRAPRRALYEQLKKEFGDA